MSEQTPANFGKYEILGELGRGGFATVYRAHDPDLDRELALKVLAPHLTWDTDFTARFQQEARIAARLSHPNIITVYETGEVEGQLFIAMELAQGGSLHDRLQAHGAMNEEQSRAILAQVGQALDYAHRRGIVHRDVKPANILLDPNAEGGPRALLSDFGLIKAVAASNTLTQSGAVLGTVEYMAPEQAEPNQVDAISPATDIYALGVVAYHMLTGRVPFSGSTASVLYAHVHSAPPDPIALRADLNPQIASAIMRALAKAPADRYGNASEFVAALRGGPIPSQTLPRPASSPGPVAAKLVPARDYWLAIAGFGLITGLALMVGMLIGGENRLLTGVAMGALAGLGQWFLLRRFVPEEEGWWIAATTLGYALAWPVTVLYDGSLDVASIMLPVGAVIGLAQALALRRYSPDHRWWLVATVAGYAAGTLLGGSTFALADLLFDTFTTSQSLFIFVLGATVGLCQGFGLVHLRRLPA